jgi:Potential Queuosine, Q, salvage protein family
MNFAVLRHHDYCWSCSCADVTLRIVAGIGNTVQTHPQVDSQQQMTAGSEMEIEIRACTIVAVEMLRCALDAQMQSTDATAASPGSEWTAASIVQRSTAGLTGGAGGSSPATTAADPMMEAGSTEEHLDNRKSAPEQPRQGVTAVLVDWWLWGRGEAQRDTAPPHHKTLTIYY